MKTIIIDDEQPAIKILRQFAAKIPFLEVLKATSNPMEVLEIMATQKIDLLLTDIEMPDISGVELVRSLEQKPLIIFTTAYENYALQGYELDIVDYLVKPIRFTRFLKAINKANKLFSLQQQFDNQQTVQYLSIKVEYKTVKIALDDILYIEGLKDYVKIYTTEKMYLTRLNLKGIETKLPSDKFIRIHRSFIIAKAKITTFQKSQISIGEQQFPIGSSYQEKVRQQLG